MFVIYLGREVVFETEDEEEAYAHCASLNDAYRTHDYRVEYEA